MKNFRKVAMAIGTAGFLVTTPAVQATPIQFNVASASITLGSGYGSDSGANAENGATLLDVNFTSTFIAQSQSLSNVGDSFSFNLGTINFAEPNTGNGSNLGIRNAERDNLGVTASFIFTSPWTVSVDLATVGVATQGPIIDSPEAVDYTLTWQPVLTSFGLDGLFEISFNKLSFDNNGTQSLTATVSLLAVPEVTQISQVVSQAIALQTVPEPTSLALLGLGLAGLGFARRKRSAQ